MNVKDEILKKANEHSKTDTLSLLQLEQMANYLDGMTCERISFDISSNDIKYSIYNNHYITILTQRCDGFYIDTKYDS